MTQCLILAIFQYYNDMFTAPLLVNILVALKRRIALNPQFYGTKAEKRI